jgi:hypothetical protein
MANRAQIDRIARRIEALAPKSDRVVYVWRNLDETEEEVLERHYRAFPADRVAAQTYVFSWQSDGEILSNPRAGGRASNPSRRFPL